MIEAQLDALADQADEAKIRAVVSETPIAEQEWSEAHRHAEQFARRARLRRRDIAELERVQDELIGKLVPLSASPRVRLGQALS